MCVRMCAPVLIARLSLLSCTLIFVFFNLPLSRLIVCLHFSPCPRLNNLELRMRVKSGAFHFWYLNSLAPASLFFPV
jgi:hypothetical protein